MINENRSYKSTSLCDYWQIAIHSCRQCWVQSSSPHALSLTRHSSRSELLQRLEPEVGALLIYLIRNYETIRECTHDCIPSRHLCFFSAEREREKNLARCRLRHFSLAKSRSRFRLQLYMYRYIFAIHGIKILCAWFVLKNMNTTCGGNGVTIFYAQATFNSRDFKKLMLKCWPCCSYVTKCTFSKKIFFNIHGKILGTELKFRDGRKSEARVFF